MPSPLCLTKGKQYEHEDRSHSDAGVDGGNRLNKSQLVMTVRAMDDRTLLSLAAVVTAETARRIADAERRYDASVQRMRDDESDFSETDE